MNQSKNSVPLIQVLKARFTNKKTLKNNGPPLKFSVLHEIFASLSSPILQLGENDDPLKSPDPGFPRMIPGLCPVCSPSVVINVSSK
jgi:hypothetical protein